MVWNSKSVQAAVGDNVQVDIRTFIYRNAKQCKKERENSDVNVASLKEDWVRIIKCRGQA